MRHSRSARWILMTLLLCLVPASSYAGVFISVGFAPPPLVVYEQPPCPEPGLMWTPGYWAYGPDGYYWVPGAWVPAPYSGALWTPGYWGWSTGLYVWHPGYWGAHVGYYGGVNYGFGYMGVGFVGGAWHGGAFAYNTAVVHVNTVVVRNTYIDRTIVERNTIVNDRHVAFSGGPGGINHAPSSDERMAMNERHLAPTSFQAQHANTAMGDHNAYFRNNAGRPQNAVMSRPLAAENHPAPFNNNRANPESNSNRGNPQFNNNRVNPEMNRGGNTFGSQPHPTNENTYHPAPQNGYRQAPQSAYRPVPPNTYHPAPQNEQRNDSRPAPQNHPRDSKPPKGR